MPDSGESTDHTQTIKSGLPYHIPYHFRALKRPCPAVSNHVQPCPTMSGHVWTQVDMLIDPASGLKKSNWFAYHFRIPLYHTSAKRIKTTPYTSMIPVNVEHWQHLRPMCRSAAVERLFFIGGHLSWLLPQSPGFCACCVAHWISMVLTFLSGETSEHVTHTPRPTRTGTGTHRGR